MKTEPAPTLWGGPAGFKVYYSYSSYRVCSLRVCDNLLYSLQRNFRLQAESIVVDLEPPETALVGNRLTDSDFDS